MLTTVILISPFILLSFLLSFFLIRNQWVYQVRIKTIGNPDPPWYMKNRSVTYEELLSYDEMMYKWWVWDVEKLRKKESK
jgi:hypothetical protein